MESIEQAANQEGMEFVWHWSEDRADTARAVRDQLDRAGLHHIFIRTEDGYALFFCEQDLLRLISNQDEIRDGAHEVHTREEER